MRCKQTGELFVNMQELKSLLVKQTKTNKETKKERKKNF